jgi:hypothetical protein
MGKVTTSCITLPLVTKHGSTIMSQRANTIIWNKNTFQKEVQISQQQEKVMLTLFWDSEGSILHYYHE